MAGTNRSAAWPREVTRFLSGRNHLQVSFGRSRRFVFEPKGSSKEQLGAVELLDEIHNAGYLW
jgi:hypothetical protein